MLDTFEIRRFKILNWEVIVKVITTPPRKKKYPSHIAITITTYTGRIFRIAAWLTRLFEKLCSLVERKRKAPSNDDVQVMWQDNAGGEQKQQKDSVLLSNNSEQQEQGTSLP